MHGKRLISPFLFFLMLSGICSGQQPAYVNYSVKSGLPSAKVYDVCQDKEGYMWFGTDYGVSRFDGYEFENFSVADGLSDVEVFQVREDRKGRIWFLTLNGLASYYDHGEFRQLPEKWRLDEWIADMYEDEEGIYLASRMGSWLHFSETDTVFVKAVNKLQGGTSMLTKINGRITGVSRYSFFQEVDGGIAMHNKINARGFNTRGARNEEKILVGLDKVLLLVNANDLSVEKRVRLEEFMGQIIFVGTSKEGWWVGTQKGMYLLNEQLEIEQKFLENEWVSNVLVDRDGSIWMTTLHGGAFYFSAPEILVLSEKDGLPYSNIECLEIGKDGAIWMGHINTRFSVQRDGIVTTYIPPSRKKAEVTGIRIMENGETWIVAKSGMVRMSDGDTTYFQVWANDVLFDEDYLWVGGNALLKVPRSELEEFGRSRRQLATTPKAHLPTIEWLERVGRVNAMCRDTEGSILFATDNGLLEARRSADSLEFVEHRFAGQRVVDVEYDAESGEVFALTAGTGLYRIGVSGMQHLGVNEGLAGEFGTVLHLDKKRRLWVGTSAGLSKYDIRERKVINYSRTSGLGALKINDIKVKGDLVYLATGQGLLSFDYNKLYPEAYHKPVRLRKVLVNGEEMELSELQNLRYYQCNLSIDFVSLAYKNLGTTQYLYNLQGLDTTWSQTNQISVNYNALPPGAYTFRVKTVDGTGEESEIYELASISIRPALWKQIWFQVVVVLLILFLVMAFWMSRMRSVRRKHHDENLRKEAEKQQIQTEKHIIELEQQALRMQMNPHFLFNALNAIKGYYAESQIREANRYIASFATLLRLILESREQLIPVSREVRMLELYIELMQMRYEGKFDFRIQVDPEIRVTEHGIPPMLLQPFVENAIIHGIIPMKGEGELKIAFSRSEKSLICSIEDNGIGRAASEKLKKGPGHKSMAIKITRERLELIGGQTELETMDLISPEGTPLGTRVRISLPLIELNEHDTDHHN